MFSHWWKGFILSHLRLNIYIAISFWLHKLFIPRRFCCQVWLRAIFKSRKLLDGGIFGSKLQFDWFLSGRTLIDDQAGYLRSGLAHRAWSHIHWLCRWMPTTSSIRDHNSINWSHILWDKLLNRSTSSFNKLNMPTKIEFRILLIHKVHVWSQGSIVKVLIMEWIMKVCSFNCPASFSLHIFLIMYWKAAVEI